MHFAQHNVGFGIGEEAAAADRRQLRWIAKHQQRHAERHQIAPELGIDHGALVDDDELRLGCGRGVPQFKVRGLLLAFKRLVDQAVYRGGAAAALAAHDLRGLAGEGCVKHLAVHRLGDMLGERGLAGTRIAEQAENLWRVAAARLGLEPVRDRLEGGILM